MTHLDLFSGIGGFALAADRVWGNVEHIFVEIDPFCQRVLTKHWPEARIYGDIRTVTNTNKSGSGTPTSGADTNRQTLHKGQEKQPQLGTSGQVDLLTGGFPCQPFSQAGKRAGTADNRYLWPEMFRVIREFKPTWVIAENVRGLLTWSEGLVFEQVCADLESEGYEVQPFIIPACSVNAPHRRDRVWFVAHKSGERLEGSDGSSIAGCTKSDSDAPNSNDTGLEEARSQQQAAGVGREGWERDWREVAAATCNVRMDDGIPEKLDKFGGYTRARHRQERLKALGNAIVPQIAEKIMRGMV